MSTTEPKMITMTLAKALNYKNRLIERIRECDDKIRRYNRVLADPTSESCNQNRPYNVYGLLEKRDAIVDHLTDLKTAITIANQKRTIDGTGPTAQELIFALAEVKTKIVLLQTLNCTPGEEVTGYNGEKVTYSAQIDERSRDNMLEELREEIDSIQDYLTVFNVETNIQVAEMTDA